MRFEEKLHGIKAPSLRRLYTLKKEVIELLSDQFYGEQLDGAAIEDWVQALVRRFGCPIAAAPLREFLLAHAGTELDRQGADVLAWKVAANWDAFKCGMCVPASLHSIDAEWCACKVSKVALSDVRRVSEPVWEITLLVLSGPAASHCVRALWTARFMRYLSQFVGFSKPWRNRPFSHPREMYGMLFLACLSWKKGSLRCISLAAPAAYCHENRKLIKMRARDGFSCPFGIETPCFRCVFGEDRCPAAVRERTAVLRDCSVCGRKCASEERGTVLCQRCARKER